MVAAREVMGPQSHQGQGRQGLDAVTSGWPGPRKTTLCPCPRGPATVCLPMQIRSVGKFTGKPVAC